MLSVRHYFALEQAGGPRQPSFLRRFQRYLRAFAKLSARRFSFGRVLAKSGRANLNLCRASAANFLSHVSVTLSTHRSFLRARGKQRKTGAMTTPPSTRHANVTPFVLAGRWALDGLTNKRCDRLVRKRSENMWGSPTSSSNSTSAVSFSSARTTKRFRLSRCVLTIQIVRALESIAETQPQLQPAWPRFSAI